MKYFLVSIGTMFLVAVIGLVCFFNLTPQGKTIINNWQYSLEKVDENTYRNKKEVENTCRAMISSYNADKLIYEQYKESTNNEEKSWANNAKIRANNTASTYNNYIIKNQYVWANNVPEDIYMVLPYIQ